MDRSGGRMGRDVCRPGEQGSGGRAGGVGEGQVMWRRVDGCRVVLGKKGADEGRGRGGTGWSVIWCKRT